MTISGGTYTSSSSTHSVPTMQFDNSGGNFIFPADVRSNAKTYIFIFCPLTASDFIMMGDGSSSRYSFYFLNGNTSAGDFVSPGFSTWAGESRKQYVNSSTQKTTRDAGYDALDFTKYNMAAVTGLNATSTLISGGWVTAMLSTRIASHVRAVIAYDNVLTTTQLAAISSFYSDELGSSNMTAWSS